MFTNIILFALLQNANLVYTDIFEATKPGMSYTNYTYYPNGTYTYRYYNEANVIAAPIWKAGLWDEGYAVALVGNFAGAYLLDKFDNTGISSQIFLAIISLAEIWAISTWDQAKIPGINLTVSANILTFQF
jgi:hypothetical protein